MDVCPFCHPPHEDISSKNAAHSSSASGQTTLCIAKNDLCFALWDHFPVNKGHALVIPFRHTPDFFSLTPEERAAVCDLVVVCRGLIEENFSPDGYNVGFNVLRGIKPRDMRRHQSSSWRSRGADGVSLSLSCDTAICRGCAGSERRGAGGCAGEEGAYGG